MTNRVRGGYEGGESTNSGFRKFLGRGLRDPLDPHRWEGAGYSSSTDMMLPAGSVNQAISGPSPRKMPLSSTFGYISNFTPAARSWSTVVSMSPTGKFSTVYVAGSWFDLG